MSFLFGANGDSHAKKGLLASDQGNFRETIKEIETALKKGLKSYKKHELLAVLGRAYNQVGENQKAVEVCKEATQMFHHYAPAWNNMGIAYFNLGRYEDAETCYLQSLQIDPNYAFASASLGALHIHTNKPEKAKDELERAVRSNPSLNVAHGNLALVYAMLGEFDKANATLKQATILGYKNWREVGERIQALAASAQLFDQPGSPPALEPAAGFPYTRYPATAQGAALTREADELLGTGKRREAINLYNKVLDLEPNCAYVLVQCGQALQGEGRVADAIQRYALAMKIDPDYGYAYNARGWARHYLGDYQGELEDGRRGLSLDPGNPALYLLRIASAYTKMKKFAQALEAYSQAIEYDPNDEGVIYNRGLCYMELGEYRKAIEDFTQALRLDPDWDWALLVRAQAYNKLGERSSALEDVNEVLRLFPDHERALKLKEVLK